MNTSDKKNKHMQLEDRIEIQECLCKGMTFKAIAYAGVITPSFKEMMDSYEAFFDEYIAFTKKYKENPSDLDLLSEYADNMSKYSDYMDKLSTIEQDDLSAADLAYYTEVYTRIMKKMAEAGE